MACGSTAQQRASLPVYDATDGLQASSHEDAAGLAESDLAALKTSARRRRPCGSRGYEGVLALLKIQAMQPKISPARFARQTMPARCWALSASKRLLASGKLSASQRWTAGGTSADAEAGGLARFGSNGAVDAVGDEAEAVDDGGASRTAVSPFDRSPDEVGSHRSASNKSNRSRSSSRQGPRGRKSGTPTALKVNSLAKSCLQNKGEKPKKVREIEKEAQDASPIEETEDTGTPRTPLFSSAPQARSQPLWIGPLAGGARVLTPRLSTAGGRSGHGSASSSSMFLPAVSPRSATDTDSKARSPVSPTHAFDRQANRDIKLEIKRMKDNLLTSAQSAFGLDVWETCGVESEHLRGYRINQFLGGSFMVREKEKIDSFQHKLHTQAHGGAEGRSASKHLAEGRSASKHSAVSSEDSIDGGQPLHKKRGAHKKTRTKNHRSNYLQVPGSKVSTGDHSAR